MRDELVRHPKAGIRVFTVWFDMLPTDSKSLVDLRVLGDHRVINYWDAGRTAGAWFGANVTHGGGVVWDYYFLYGPQATWGDAPGPLLGSGGPVVSVADDINAGLRPFLSTPARSA